ncbi:MAG: TIGR03960 family B12-binding radical SAM protein [Deltaproteobacteria bacterium]|nr:TIGR03960 family B12-binding radical SAM protein [Deltaproteobacteria bacterium]
MDASLLKSILRCVQKPAQYAGGEVNATHKDFDHCRVRVVLVFPDAYEIGMSHTGLKILYDILNKENHIVAERCFAPFPDMEEQLRAQNIPLFSLESKTPLCDFDLIGITLPFELVYTNVLNIIDLAKIPLKQNERKDHHPIILGGGTQCYNPEPLADFFDAFAIGDGEELILDVVHKILHWKNREQIDRMSHNTRAGSRDALINDLTEIEGIYVPKYFETDSHGDGTIKETKALNKNYPSIKKRIVKDLNLAPAPVTPIIPNIRLIHDRIGIEIQRGCSRMCRFCQAGVIERPVRQRDPLKVIDLTTQSVHNSGLEEISLLSLSAGDYQTIIPTLKILNHHHQDNKIAISVPATRTETLNAALVSEIKKVRKTGFTIAPEAGSERMRRVINKGNRTEDLLMACENAFSQGYRLIKLYYMCGLPFETDEDLICIATEANECLKIGKKYSSSAQINLSLSTFIPKPFTPFQWESQITITETRRRQNLIKHHLKSRSINFKYHAAETSWLEGLFARGDRRLGRTIEHAFKLGCRFDQWTEYFDFTKWQKSIEDTHVDPCFYIDRKRSPNEIFPFDHLYSQMKRSWLWQEYQKAEQESDTQDCSIGKCAANCGVCNFKDIKNKIYVIDKKTVAQKKGNREWYGRFGEDCPINHNPYKAENTTRADTMQKLMPKRVEKTFQGFKPCTTKPESNHTSPAQYRLRVKFEKTDFASFFGHLELMSIIKRAMQRSQIKLCYTQGFHPQIKLSMGPALSSGIESDCEYFDVYLQEDIQSFEFINKNNAYLPQGLRFLSAEYIDLKCPSLYLAIEVIDFKIILSDFVSREKTDSLHTNLHSLKRGVVFDIIKNKPQGKTETVHINDYLVLDRLGLDQKQILLPILCTDRGSIKPLEIVAALSGFTDKELKTINVRKVAVTLR